jgi:hypothetical protein
MFILYHETQPCCPACIHLSYKRCGIFVKNFNNKIIWHYVMIQIITLDENMDFMHVGNV